jgi:hypothetical protein
MLGFDPESVERFFTNGLIVVGGFALGYVFTGMLAYAFDKWATKGQSPAGLHKLIRWIGGIVVAVIVALYLFQGGKGTGGTGGEGNAPSPQLAGTGSVNTPVTSQTPTSTKPVPNVQTHEIIRVTILGGSQPEAKYYVAEDESRRTVDIDGIKSHILNRKKSSEKPVVLELRRHPTPTILRNNPIVTDLENWARNEERLGVIFPGDGP